MSNPLNQINKILALLRSNDFQSSDIDELIALAKSLPELTPVDIIIDKQGVRVESGELTLPVSIKDYRDIYQLNMNDPVFTDKQGRSYIERGTVLEFNEDYITHDRLVKAWSNEYFSNTDPLDVEQETKAFIEASLKMRFATNVDLAVAKDLLAWAKAGKSGRAGEAIFYAIRVRDALAATPSAQVSEPRETPCSSFLARDKTTGADENQGKDALKKSIAESLSINRLKIVGDTFAFMGRNDVYLDEVYESKNEFHVHNERDENSVDIEFYYCTDNADLSDEVVVRFESRVWLYDRLITCGASLYYSDSTGFGVSVSPKLQEEVNSISVNLMKSLQDFLSGYDIVCQIGEVHDMPGRTFLEFCRTPCATENQDSQDDDESVRPC